MMSLSRSISSFAIFAMLTLPNSVGAVLPASARESQKNAVQTGESPLLLEYRRICVTTKRDSPEYREAIERALAEFHERGGADVSERNLRHQLGLSYRKIKQYAKSSEILKANLGESGDTELRATDMLLIARNARDSDDLGEAVKRLEELVSRHPATIAGQTAKAELQSPRYGRYVLECQLQHQKSWKGVFIGVDLAVVVILVTTFVVRRMKRMRTGCAN